MKIWDFLKNSMLKHPNQYICENDAKMNYDDIIVHSELFAEKLSSEKCCAIMCNSEMATAMAILACLAAGVTAVPLSLRYGEKHCKRIIEFIEPTALITDSNQELSVFRFDNSNYIQPSESPAFIMCTSGTTGHPKGVMLSNDNIITNISDISDYFDISEDDSILISRPLYHASVLTGEFFTSLLKGTKIRFVSENFNPISLIHTINKYSITTFCGTPTIFGTLSRYCRSPNSYIKNIGVSGECISSAIGDRMTKTFPDANIYHGYGLTEASPRVSYLPPPYFKEYSEYVGIPLKSVKVKIITNNGKVASPGEKGVLWVSGASIMLGYYKSMEQTNRVLNDGWLCTGDIASIDKSGFIKIFGRNDNMIIRAGVNIYPQEIEGILKNDTRVYDVYVYGIANERFGNEIAMKIAGNFKCVDEVRVLCQETLPSYQIPAHIELVKEISHTPTGKIARIC